MSGIAYVLLLCVGAANLSLAVKSQTTPPYTCPKKCSCSANFTIINCAKSKLKQIPENIPSVAKTLDLSENELREIPAGAFSTLVNLSELLLERNKIGNLGNDSFLGLKNLKRLHLRQNGLADLPRAVFRDLVNLQHLYLEINKLKAVPDVSLAIRLTILSLDTNELTSVAFLPGFEKLGYLNTISLPNNNKFNRITKADFQHLNRIGVRTINLSGCDLRSVESDVFNFVHLQSITLSYNPALNETSLRNIFQGIGKTTKHNMSSLVLSGTINRKMSPDLFQGLEGVPLDKLQLDNSQLGQIVNGTFDFFFRLTYLNLASCKISEIERGVLNSKLASLKTLNLKSNALGSVPNMDLPHLEDLNLSRNGGGSGIYKIPKGSFSRVPALKKLNLRDCSIREIYDRSFDGLSNLQTLDLSLNKIAGTNLPRSTFRDLESLVTLDLSENQMYSIATEFDLFSSLASLQSLDLSANSCSNISARIFHPLKNLTSLNLASNLLGDVIERDQDCQLLQGLGNIQKLSLQNSTIRTLPSRWLFDQINVESLDLSKNLLTSWPENFLSQSLLDDGNRTIVNLALNRISTVEELKLITLPNGVRLNLSANPFVCDCHLMWFRRWISARNASAARLLGLRSYLCSSPAPSRPLLDFDPASIEEACRPPPWRLIAGGVGGGVAAFAFILVGLGYRYRWPLKLKIYRFRKWASGGTGTRPGYQRLDASDEGYDYSVMVSYGPSKRDLSWVRNVLMPEIDRRESALRARLAAEEAASKGVEPDGSEGERSEDEGLNWSEGGGEGSGGVSEGAGGDRVARMGQDRHREEGEEIHEERGEKRNEGRNEERTDDGGAGRDNNDTIAIETYDVFFEYRDTGFNASVIGALSDAIYTAGRILLVVSADYLRDDRRRFEITLAVESCMRRGWTELEGLIVVQLDPGLDVQLPTTLHPLTRAHRVIDWMDNAAGREMFWEKLRGQLRQALPGGKGGPCRHCGQLARA